MNDVIDNKSINKLYGIIFGINADEIINEQEITYLKEWLKYARVSKFRKVIGVTGVLLESLLCFIIKCLIIVIAYVTTLGSIMIREIYRYLSPIFVLTVSSLSYALYITI